jgi:hypothetical protein
MRGEIYQSTFMSFLCETGNNESGKPSISDSSSQDAGSDST